MTSTSRDGPDAASLLIALAVDGLFATEYEAMERWGKQAVEAAAPLADRSLIAAALAVRAAGAAMAGLGAQARERCSEAAELIDGLSDEELARRLDALAHLANAELYLDQFEAAARHAERALIIGRATGQGELFPFITVTLGSCRWLAGRTSESGDIFDGAIEASRLQNNIQATMWHLFNRSLAALAAGDTDLALSTAEESMEIAASSDRSPLTIFCAVALAAALAETGEPGRAATMMVSSAGDELRGIGGGWRARYLELLTRCLIASGRRVEAERAAAASQACADEVQLPMAAAMASCAAAALDFDAGDYAAAADRALDCRRRPRGNRRRLRRRHGKKARRARAGTGR